MVGGSRIFGDFQGVIADYNKALRLDPKLDRGYINRAIVRYEVGDAAGAVADLRIVPLRETFRVQKMHSDRFSPNANSPRA
jgi:hypothetical protein